MIAPNLTLEDLNEAEAAIVAFSQRQQFRKEIDALSSSPVSKIKRDIKLYKLDPICQDFLRVGGRLRNSAMPEERKHPIILAKDKHIATLILRHIYQQLSHSGNNHMLSKLRKRYWIIKGNAAARKIIFLCTQNCRRFGVKASEQKMADLPKERLIQDLPPFTNVEVDYFWSCGS